MKNCLTIVNLTEASYLDLQTQSLLVTSVFRIRDILIRFRILGSVHWIMDPDLYPASDPALFFSGFQGAKKEIVLRIAYCK
jgi:hypothetical protein